jgi:hypothetical protein
MKSVHELNSIRTRDMENKKHDEDNICGLNLEISTCRLLQ